MVPKTLSPAHRWQLALVAGITMFIASPLTLVLGTNGGPVGILAAILAITVAWLTRSASRPVLIAAWTISILAGWLALLASALSGGINQWWLSWAFVVSAIPLLVIPSGQLVRRGREFAEAGGHFRYYATIAGIFLVFGAGLAVCIALLTYDPSPL